MIKSTEARTWNAGGEAHPSHFDLFCTTRSCIRVSRPNAPKNRLTILHSSYHCLVLTFAQTQSDMCRYIARHVKNQMLSLQSDQCVNSKKQIMSVGGNY